MSPNHLDGGCLSLITVSVSFLGKNMLKEGAAASFLVLAMLVIGMGAGAALWLKHVNQDFHS